MQSVHVVQPWILSNLCHSCRNTIYLASLCCSPPPFGHLIWTKFSTFRLFVENIDLHSNSFYLIYPFKSYILTTLINILFVHDNCFMGWTICISRIQTLMATNPYNAIGLAYTFLTSLSAIWNIQLSWNRVHRRCKFIPNEFFSKTFSRTHIFLKSKYAQPLYC